MQITRVESACTTSGTRSISSYVRPIRSVRLEMPGDRSASSLFSDPTTPTSSRQAVVSWKHLVGKSPGPEAAIPRQNWVLTREAIGSDLVLHWELNQQIRMN